MEWVAAAAGLLNVYLLIRQSIWSWSAGLVQVFLYIFIFYHNALYSDVILHIIYVILNIYGWYRWYKGQGGATPELAVSLLSNRTRMGYILGILAGFLIWGTIMKRTTQADFMYADAFILAASLCAQYLLAEKKLENWILWISVDVVAIILYFYKKLYVTSGLYGVFLVLCIIGFISWRSAMKKQLSTDSTLSYI